MEGVGSPQPAGGGGRDSLAMKISHEVMEELLRRRQELEEVDVKTYSTEEIQRDMQAAINEVRRSRAEGGRDLRSEFRL